MFYFCTIFMTGGNKPPAAPAQNSSSDTEETKDYPHYNARLTINDFDLLKV